jgi:hypothetical protein
MIGAKTTGLGLVMDSFGRSLTPEVARFLVEWKADEAAQTRYEELADKNTEGQLTPEESRELEAVVRFDSTMALLKARAQLTLRPAHG